MIAYLNGKYQQADACTISPLDRGFLFGDGVYEVLPVYHGAIFRCDDHLHRLNHSLNNIGIDNPQTNEQWEAIFSELISRCGLSELSIYLQISRGPAPMRLHIPTDDIHPTVFAMTMPARATFDEEIKQGVSVMTTDDIRWARCDIKSTSLLANVMLSMQTRKQGFYEAIMIHEGYVTEGASSNIFIVTEGRLSTPPLSNKILPGITRQVVMEMARLLRVSCKEKVLTREDLLHADEIWLTSSTRNIVPVTRVDEQQIGDGKPGSLWQKFSEVLMRLSIPPDEEMPVSD